MTHSTVAELLSQDKSQAEIELKGWVRTFRANRFIALNDGSTINNIQCVIDFENTDEAILKRITTGAAVHIKGQLVDRQKYKMFGNGRVTLFWDGNDSHGKSAASGVYFILIDTGNKKYSSKYK